MCAQQLFDRGVEVAPVWLRVPLVNTGECICKVISWDEVLGRRNTCGAKPFGAAKNGADNGCHLCSLLFGSLLVHNGFPGTRPVLPDCQCLDSEPLILYGNLEKSYIILEVPCRGRGGAHMARLALSTMTHNVALDFRQELREIKNRRRGGPEMVDLDLDDLTKCWIQDCVHTHRLCPMPKDAPLPTRLVDVGSNKDPIDSVRLVITKGMTGKWTALSYCWGEANKLCTTSETLEECLRRIPLDRLPKTIQDAILVTRKLGIQYLWVDTLCIIQGSEQDWQAESAMMMNIYRNSYITIAANGSLDAQGGLFLDRNRLQSRPCKIQLRSQDGKDITRWIHPPRAPWRGVIQNAPLQKRGWTLQETNLSIRVIYYDKMGLYWQCREGVRQERAPANLITANDPLVPRRLFDAYAGDPMNVFTLWCDHVKDFTSRNLTFESDKLAAISGLASALSAFIQSRSERRLASQEEKRFYSPPERPTHWAIPQPSESDMVPHLGGGNVGFQDILTSQELSASRAIHNHTRGPLSMDPFLTLRHLSELDADADQELSNPSNPRTREILEEVGLGPLQQFVSQTDNPDYHDEYIIIMSHPHTHKAYQNAYHIWKSEREGNHRQNQRSGQLATSEPRAQGTIARRAQHLSDEFEAMFAANDAGTFLDPDLETEMADPCRTNMYIYGDSGPVKAIVEWPSYGMDDRYFAGIWKADLLYGLQWYCPTPGRRATYYRAPTWSWASMDSTRVLYDRNFQSYSRQEGDVWSGKWHAKILDVSAVPRGPNSFGDVKSAKLTLLAPIREMPFYTDVDDHTIPSTSAEKNGVFIQPKSDPMDAPLPEPEFLCLDEQSRYLAPSLKILRLDSLTCLVLEPVSGTREAGVFRRVGHWRSSRGENSRGFHGKNGLDGWEAKVAILI